MIDPDGMVNEALQRYLNDWGLEADGLPIETHSSWLIAVRHDRGPAMLKVLKAGGDEHNAAELLQYFDGLGAVRVYEVEHKAFVMERVAGIYSLATMATTSGDMRAAALLAETVRLLHARRQQPPPQNLTPLGEWFSALYRHEQDIPILGRCARMARGLIASARDIIPLHGDLHHDNVLDGGERGWLAIDPKALLGERAYDIANLLGNPWPHGDIVHDPARMRRLAGLFADRLDLDLGRVLAFAFAHSGLSASWDLEDGSDPAYRLRCAEVLEIAIEDLALS